MSRRLVIYTLVVWIGYLIICNAYAESWPKVEFSVWQSVDIATMAEKPFERYAGSYGAVQKKTFPPVTPKRQCNKRMQDGSFEPYICGEGEKK